jgi:hypothetical protein
MDTTNNSAEAEPKRKVRSPEERRAFLEQQLRAFDAREDARLRASAAAIVADIERLKSRANKAMKGKLYDACTKAIEALSQHTQFPST